MKVRTAFEACQIIVAGERLKLNFEAIESAYKVTSVEDAEV